MRLLLILTLSVLNNFAFGQQRIASFGHISDIYVFNNSIDTIYLTKVNLGEFSFTQSFIIADTIQIDSLGSKEIIFIRQCNGNTKAHGGSFDIEDHKVITKHEIWNLDTKTLLFEAIPVYKNDFNNSYNYYNRWGTYRQGQGSAAYKYDFKIDKNGQVSISNLMNTADCAPDHVEGTYKFLNGKYDLE